KCRPHIILTQVLHQRVLRQNRQRRKLGNHVAEHRKEHVVDLSSDLLEEAEVFPIIRTKTAEWENVQEASASKEHQERCSQRPSGNGITEEDNKTASEIKLRAMLHRFPQSYRKADHV